MSKAVEFSFNSIIFTFCFSLHRNISNQPLMIKRKHETNIKIVALNSNMPDLSSSYNKRGPCLFRSPPLRSFTSSAAVSPAWHWSCKPCFQPSSHRSARRSSKASCWTPLTCWLQLMTSLRCWMKRLPSKCPAAKRNHV